MVAATIQRVCYIRTSGSIYTYHPQQFSFHTPISKPLAVLPLVVIRSEASVCAFILTSDRQVIKIDTEGATRFQAHTDSRHTESTIFTSTTATSGSAVNATSGR